MGVSVAQTDFEEAAKVAEKLKNKGKNEEKCFTSGHVCGKMCACEK